MQSNGPGIDTAPQYYLGYSSDVFVVLVEKGDCFAEQMLGFGYIVTGQAGAIQERSHSHRYWSAVRLGSDIVWIFDFITKSPF